MFIDNRELSILFWGFLILIFFLFWKKTSPLILGLFKILFSKHIFILVLILGGYFALISFCLKEIGFWNISHLAVSIFWFFSVGLIFLFKAVKNCSNLDFFKNSLFEIFSITLIVDFLINLFVFDLIFEFLFIPATLILGFFIGATELNKETKKENSCFNNIAVLLGLGLLVNAGYEIIVNFEEIQWFIIFQAFSIPIIFSLFLVPFLYFVTLYVRLQTLWISLQFKIKDKSLLKFAKRHILFTYGLRRKRLLNFAEKIFTFDLSSKNTIKKEIKEFNEKPIPLFSQKPGEGP